MKYLFTIFLFTLSAHAEQAPQWDIYSCESYNLEIGEHLQCDYEQYQDCMEYKAEQENEN